MHLVTSVCPESTVSLEEQGSGTGRLTKSNPIQKWVRAVPLRPSLIA